jgi:hypothetical protein
MATTFDNNPASNSTSATEDYRGWVDGPDTRGTMDIIWPCISTVTLLLFSMLHLNVPASSDGITRRFWRKLRWFLLGSLCPELPMLFAFAQLASARRSREDMKALGVHDWTITHGFYADSGGFMLDIAGIRPFPITAKQLLYLVRHQHIDAPRIKKIEIDDKSTADAVAKCLTFFQSGRFITNIITHAASGLRITPLELMASAILFCSSITLCLWWHKPLDVTTPTILKAKGNISTLLAQAGDAAKDPFRDTPLDFIESDIYWCSKWSHGGMMQRLLSKRGWQLRRPLERMYLFCWAPISATSRAAGLGRAINNPQKRHPQRSRLQTMQFPREFCSGNGCVCFWRHSLLRLEPPVSDKDRSVYLAGELHHHGRIPGCIRSLRNDRLLADGVHRGEHGSVWRVQKSHPMVLCVSRFRNCVFCVEALPFG